MVMILEQSSASSALLCVLCVQKTYTLEAKCLHSDSNAGFFGRRGHKEARRTQRIPAFAGMTTTEARRTRRTIKKPHD